MDRLLEMFMKEAKVVKEYKFNRVTIQIYDNAATGYALDDKTVTKFYSLATTKDNRKIDTRSAKRKNVVQDTNKLEVYYEENDLELIQYFTFFDNNYFYITLGIKDKNGKTIESNYMAPMDFAYPDKQCNPLFLSLEQKMLLIPYDNDMWVSYESTPLRPGRTSYDVTAIYNELSNNGIVIGALDYDTWKNAIKCSWHDARCYTAFSGVADEGTHDSEPHGYLIGKEIKSSRFMLGWYEDIRDGMEEFSKLAMEDKFAFKWNAPNPWGWNSYSAGCMTLEQWQEAGSFINSELPEFGDKDKVTYINLDANFLLDKKKMKKIVDEIHSRGQKAGNYMAPLLGNEQLEFINPLKGSKGHKMSEIMMKHDDGSLFEKIDSGRPVDLSNPLTQAHVRGWIQEIVEMGFDYIKIDFISHGGCEGIHYDPNIRTGRQALQIFYKILEEELNPEKIGKQVFIDFSIAPLFPGGFAHGRRSCCDAFGHHEDVKYVLNSLNYGWWQSGSLYCYNDPDHTVLSKSQVDGRGFTDLNSAKSRYNASLISGTVMLLSDNYGPFGTSEDKQSARQRARLIANNPRLNEVGRIEKPFRPVYLKANTCNVYYLNDEKNYVALFNFDNQEKTISVDAKSVNMPIKGKLINLEDNNEFDYENNISMKLDAYASCILEVKE